ncbi:MAG: glutamate synthase subunit beta [FCB group bacterium]|nr:glutamate synthase subunit beta [FCB group bacterium]
MGKVTGFLEYERELPEKYPPQERIKNFCEFVKDADFGQKILFQAARCMDCGVPFCHNGCPLGNIIPEFNDAVYNESWAEAYEILSSTNNFPEFTGRICPAPCEAACVLGINQQPVTIENIEKNIAESAFRHGVVKPNPPKKRTGKKVAVVGSGPAGLAAAAQLNSAGHEIVVFERSDAIGGLLRFGIPDFKLEKWIIDRRIRIMELEGIQFRTNAEVGKNVLVRELTDGFDAIVLAGGSTIPRDLPVKGRDLKGVHFAMEFLTQTNKRIADIAYEEESILARGKNVVVIGGGDTGADCVGTAIRQRAKSVIQFEILPKPPLERTKAMPWPTYPTILRTASAHEEGCERFWSVSTKEFIGDEKGNLRALKVVDVEWEEPKAGQRPGFREIEGSERIVPCELVLLAMGFLHPQHEGMLEKFGVELDSRGNVLADNYQTSVKKVFTAGDMHRGQSLVVWAISEGRECARAVDIYLMGKSYLEAKADSLMMCHDVF